MDSINAADLQDVSSMSAIGGVFMLAWAAIFLALAASVWKIFVKAGKPGWASLIPIYNIIVMNEIAGRPTWFIALCFIPLANIYAAFSINMGLAKAFGKSSGFGIGLTLLPIVFLPLLGFSQSQYTNNNPSPNQPVRLHRAA